MSQNQNKRTLRTIGLVVAVTLLTKILGIVREALQAGVFGTQTAFDLYTISYNYTIYIFTTVAYALCIAAVPVISRHLAEDRNKAFAVAGNLICVSVLVSALVVVLLSVLIRFAPVGHWLGVSDADLPTLRTYLQICLLTLPLIVVIYLLVAVFQSMEHYTLQGSLSLPYNLLLIVFLVLFSSSERVLEYVLVICFAWLLQFAMTIPCIVREKFRLIPGLHFRDPDLKLFARTTVVTVFTTSIFLLCYLADSNTVSAFGSGAVSAVYYAMLCVSRFSIVKSHTRTRQIADRVQRLTQEMSVYHRTGGLLCFIGLWMLLRRRWTVPASGEDSPDDAVPAVEITAETEA